MTRWGRVLLGGILFLGKGSFGGVSFVAKIRKNKTKTPCEARQNLLETA